MKAIDDLIKNADSILNTLDKDYEAMQTQKSGVRQDHGEKFNDLCKAMGNVLETYSETISKFRSKIDRSRDSEGTEVTIYEYPNGNKILTMTPELYWTGTGVATFYIKIYVKHKGEKGCYDSETLAISETGIELLSVGFNTDKGFSDTASVFLNHCPTYEQLDVAFQTALTDFIKYCVTAVQKRNENMADKIKTITQ